MVIGHVDSFVQCHTSKPIWLSLATKIVTSKFYLLFKFGQDCFVEVCISLFSYFRAYCKNVPHAIPNDIKHFQQAQPEHYFDYTNWRLKICIWPLYFSSQLPKGDLTIFLISSPAHTFKFKEGLGCWYTMLFREHKMYHLFLGVYFIPQPNPEKSGALYTLSFF